ncbi:MAG: V-type ATP synthase subunit D [Tissierellia bacterium]|nr:V-type ATP synthase subunit D [Tissierellia bacterium]
MNDSKIAATKSNLIAIKDKLDLMNQGYDILDKKRKVLFQLYLEKIKQRDEFRKEVSDTIDNVFKKIRNSEILLGREKIKEISQTIPEDNSLKLVYKTLMQTKIPIVEFEKSKLSLSYSFNSTNSVFDETVYELSEVKEKIFKLAEYDTAIYNLNREMKKVEKKVNSLSKVQIPKYERVLKEISSQIEEKEREEFSKTKIVKNNKLKKENN